MTTDINKRNSTINMILCFVLGVVLSLCVKSCVDKPQPAIVTKGSFKPVQVTKSETKAIPGINHVPGIGKVILSTDEKAEIEKFKTLYNLTQKELDSLIVQYTALDSLKNASNDKYYQDLYEKLKPVEFTHAFKSDDSTFKATLTGISNGSPQRLKLDWEYKAPPPKQTVFRFSAGSTFGIRKTLDKVVATGLLSGQFKNGNQILIGIDTNEYIHLGGAFSIFSVKR